MTTHSGLDFRRLVGRDRERAAVEHLLAALPHTGGALAWAGPRGRGRTATLGAAESLAADAGVRVVTVRGSAVTTRPDGLAGSVGTELGAAPDESDPLPGSHGQGLVRLLQRLDITTSRHGPLLLCLDDVDRLQPSDVASVAFAARRLAALPVLLLATTGPSLTPLLEGGGLPVTPLRALTDAEAAQVLREHHPDLHPKVLDRILEAADGLPLPLVELPAALTGPQRRGAETVPGMLPLTERLRTMYTASLDALSRPAREVLTLFALDGPAPALSLLGAARPGISPSALDELERAGLLVTSDSDSPLDFAHPLMRHAVLDGLDDSELTRARELLATASTSDPDQQAWHLANAPGQVDEYLAGLLERSGRRATARGDVDQGVAAVTRAAHLSPDGHIRSRRLLEAARLRATVTGELDDAAAALAEAARADAGSMASLQAAATRGQLMVAAGAPMDQVFTLLAGALTSATPRPGPDPAAAQACLRLLFYVCLLSARPERWQAFAEVLARREGRDPAAGLLWDTLPDITKVTSASLARLEAEIARVGDLVDPAELVGVGVAAYQLDRLAPCRAALTRLAEDARRGQLVGIGVEAMLRLALDDCQTGQLSRASRLATEGLELADSVDRNDQEWTFQLCLSLVAALRGDAQRVDELTARMRTWAAPRGATLVEHHCAHIRGLAALGDGDFEAAYLHGVSINPPGTLAGHTNVTFVACLDLVEAAVHTHRDREAEAHAAAMAESGIGRLSPRLALRVATGAAMTAPDRQAAELFEGALAIPYVDRWPFDRARAHLAYGIRLRRLHLAGAAPPHLSTAYETFRRMGARGWAARAAEEMRAAGLPTPVGQRDAGVALTGRDLEIAAMAAAGLSNREIGARLFLSPRTIGSRLYRIFPKVGVSSRAALRDALADQPAPHR